MTVGRRTLFVILIILASAALCLGAVGFSARPDAPAQAAGSVLIGTADELIGLSQSVADGNNRLGETFELTADIDLTGTDFFPIGSDNAFHGSFDGKGYTVTLGLSDYRKCAFIGTLGSSGVLKNLTLRGSVSGNVLTAGAVAENEGVITNCISYVNVTNYGSAQSYSGGIAAVNRNNVSLCVNAGRIESSFNVGGIVGNLTGSLTSSVAFGSVASSGSTALNVGGVAGIASGRMTDCYAYSSVVVSATSKSNVGSVAGSTTAADGGRNYAIGGLYDFAASGSSGEVEGKFEKKSLYDFLCEDGVVFSEGNFVRADYKQGKGYLYAPAYLTEKTAEGKTVFIAEENEELFSAPLFASGDGTDASPYEIGGKEEWNLFAVNSRLFSYDGVYLTLKSDVDLGTDHSASSQNEPFNGVFDGGDKTVNIVNSDSRNNVALFAFVGNGTVKNLTVTGSLIGGENVAGVVSSVVGNAAVSGIKNACDVAASKNVGGIVGSVGQGASLVAENCVNTGRITCTGIKGAGYAGGIAGGVYGEIVLSDVANYAAVVAENSGTVGVGGIIGAVVLTGSANASVSGAHNEGAITAVKTDYAGGIIGKVETADGTASLREVSSVAEIKGKTNVGGLVGGASGRLTAEFFAVIGALSGENYVSGAATAVSGELTLGSGYVSGSITEIAGSGAATFDYDAISVSVGGSAAVGGEVYYNGDGIKGVSAVGGVLKKNSVELSGGDLFASELMSEREREITGGVYAFPSRNTPFLNKTETLTVSYFDGTDPAENVYLIGSARAMKNFAFLCANVVGYSDYSYRLVNDVTLSDELVQIPVFGGAFDGKTYTVYNLKIYADGTNGGLFGKLSGTVKNLRLSGGTVIADETTVNMGAICGEADGTAVIDGCYATVFLQGTATYVGGLVGANAGRVGTSFFAGRISGASYAGGIVGNNSGSVENCFFSGKAAGSVAVGGIAAKSAGGSITACYVSGRAEGANVGGIAAEITGTTVSKAYVNAHLVATGTKGAFFSSADGVTASSLSECFYNSDYVDATAYPTVANNSEYARTATYFRTSGAGNFSVSGFKRLSSRFNDSYDAYYAPYLEAFDAMITEGSGEYDEGTAYYVAKSAEIAIFGTDTSSDDEVGGARNPYIVESAAQFAMIAELTKYTNFIGKYFFISKDINMNDTSAGSYAIGYYSATSGNAFCGTVYGSESDRPTVSNIKVDKAASSGGEITDSYLGVFANTEEGFVLKNIIFSGYVKGSSSVGGLVGYTHKGVIENCLSYVNVTATGSNAGGIVGAASGAVTIKGTVCAGKVTAADDGYGLIGIRTVNSGGLTVSAVKSWYVIDGADASSYIHNGCGSVLYDYSDEAKGESLTVVDGKEKGYGFLLSSTGAYKGMIMDSTDNVIAAASETPYYDSSTENISRDYCARYCIPVTGKAIWSDGSDTDFAVASVSGDHYIGQEIVVALSWTDEGKARGVKFKGISDSVGNPVAYTLEPSAGDILVKFVMSEDTVSVKVSVGAISEGEILSFPKADGVEYDGETRNPTVNVEGGTAEYYLASGASKTEIKDAGVYRVSVRVSDSNNNYIGIYEKTYTVAQKTLSLGEESAFGAFYTTVYDKDTAVRTYAFNAGTVGYENCVGGVADGETPRITLEFTYATRNAGTGIGLSITACSSADGNYRFSESGKDLGACGVITKKQVRVGLVYDGEEDGKKVVIRTYSAREPELDTSVYEISVKWIIGDSYGNPATVFNVGKYTLSPATAVAADESNYEIVSEDEYILIIEKYTVSEERFTFGNTVFRYDGTDLSATISKTASFTVPFDDSNHAVNLVFYKEREGLNETAVINAGTYYAKAVPTDGNYAAEEGMPLTVITIGKKTADELVVSLKKADGTALNNGDEVTVEDRIELDLTSDGVALSADYDGVYRVETSNFTTEYDEVNGKWYLVPVAGSENAAFRIEGVSATNYENRSSATFNLKVLKKQLYGILERDEFSFGDEILENLRLAYYYKAGERVLGEEIDATNIKGLEEPSITLGTDELRAGRYTVTFSGGNSDGYSFEFFSSDSFGERVVTVLPKEILVVVNDAGSKVYGEGKENEVIPYTIMFDDGGTWRELTTLPDGTKVALNGAIGRRAGENVGEYALTQGTLTGAGQGAGALNPDYEISVRFNSSFAITKREITVAIARGQGKEYGEADGEIVIEPEDGFELVNNPELGIIDTIDAFAAAIRVFRAAGEDVGSYGYSISTDAVALAELNYAVTVADRAGNYYVITKAVPHVDFEITGSVKYGDETGELTYAASAEDRNGSKVEGTFSLYVLDFSAQGGKRTSLNLSDTTIIAEFIPADGNFESVKKSAAVTVGKRPVSVTIYKGAGEERIKADGAKFTYSGKAVQANEFTYGVSGTVFGNEEYDVVLTIDGDAKNVTKDGFTVSATLESKYYVLAEEPTVRCSVTKAVVTVTATGGVITFGEKFTPSIVYEGFLAGDGKANLTKQAGVGTVPTESGYHSLMPGGAESDNYDFVYVPGILVINGVEAESEGIKMEGTLPPGYSVTATGVASGTGAFKATANTLDAALGGNALIPLAKELKEYVSVSGSGKAGDGEFVYTLRFDAIDENDELYLKLASGELKKAEFTLETKEDGVYATFASEEIVGAAVYAQKSLKDVIIGYLPLIGIGLGLIALIVIAIIIGVAVGRNRKREKYYPVRARWK